MDCDCLRDVFVNELNKQPASSFKKHRQNAEPCFVAVLTENPASIMQSMHYMSGEKGRTLISYDFYVLPADSVGFLLPYKN